MRGGRPAESWPPAGPWGLWAGGAVGAFWAFRATCPARRGPAWPSATGLSQDDGGGALAVHPAHLWSKATPSYGPAGGRQVVGLNSCIQASATRGTDPIGAIASCSHRRRLWRLGHLSVPCPRLPRPLPYGDSRHAGAAAGAASGRHGGVYTRHESVRRRRCRRRGRQPCGAVSRRRRRAAEAEPGRHAEATALSFAAATAAAPLAAPTPALSSGGAARM